MCKFITLIVLCIAAAFALQNCSKTTNVDYLASDNDHLIVESVFADLSNQVEMGVTKTFTSCPLVTRTPDNDTVFPKTYTLTYSDAGCTGDDGRIRKGAISVVLTKAFNDTLSVATVSFSNYTVDGNKVSGTVVTTCMGRTTGGKPTYTMVSNNLGITKGDGGSISCKLNRTRVLVSGGTTKATLITNEYEVNGIISGTNSKGETFSATITKPLTIDLNCKYINKGSLELKNSNSNNSSTLDFGDGSCDNKVSVNNNSKVTVINFAY